jgi:hypothetical protein
VALLVLPVNTRAVLRTGLHGYLQALSSFAVNLGTHLADPNPDVRLRADSRALDHVLFQTRLVASHLVPYSARYRHASAVLDRLSEGARQVRTIVRHVPPSPGHPGVVTTVTPLIENLTTTVAALDRRVNGGGLHQSASSGKHELTGSAKHPLRRHSRLTARRRRPRADAHRAPRPRQVPDLDRGAAAAVTPRTTTTSPPTCPTTWLPVITPPR